MDFSISTLCLYHDRYGSVPALVRANPSIRNWEFMDDGYHRLDKKTVRELKPLAADGVRFSVHAPFSSINHSEYVRPLRELSLKILEKSIYQAAEIGARVEVVHTGMPTIFSSFFPDDATAICAESLTRLIRYGKSLGVDVVVENGVGRYDIFNTVEKITRLLDQVKETAYTCFDFGHAHITGHVSSFITTQPRICHIHVHDNAGEHDDHLPAGAGSIDWRTGLTELKGIGFQGLLVAENHASELALQSLAYLRNILKDLD